MLAAIQSWPKDKYKLGRNASKIIRCVSLINLKKKKKTSSGAYNFRSLNNLYEKEKIKYKIQYAIRTKGYSKYHPLGYLLKAKS